MKLVVEHHHYLHYDPPMLRKVLEEVLGVKQLTQALGVQMATAKEELKAVVDQINENTNQMAASLEEGVAEQARIAAVLQDLKDKLEQAGTGGLTPADVAEMKESLSGALTAQQSVEDRQKTLIEQLKSTGSDGTVTPL